MNSPIDPTELARLLDEHASSLELYAAQWTLEAEDCVQEAMIQLAAQICRPPNPVAWLYRVVKNRALNASRARQRRANHERLAHLLAQSRAVSSPSLEQEIQRGLEQLGEDERELIVLRIWSDLTWQQIAELTETSSSSAQRHYVAVLKKLKQMMEPSSCETNLKSN